MRSHVCLIFYALTVENQKNDLWRLFVINVAEIQIEMLIFQCML